MSAGNIWMIPVGIVGVAGVIYTSIKFYQLWKRFGFARFLYWILHIICLSILFVCGGKLTWIENEVIKTSFLRIAALYFVFMLYASGLILLRQFICVLGQRYQWKCRCYRFVRSTKRGVGSIAVFCFLIAAAALIFAQYRITTAYTSVELGQSMKMTMICDAHVGTAVLRSDLPEIVENIQNTEPDVIFLLGDIFDHNTSESLRRATLRAFSELSAPYGVFYVEGNHEAKLEEEIADDFRAAGIQVLYDQVTVLPNGVRIAGRRDFADDEQLPLETVLAGIDRRDPVILLSHQPRELKKAEKLGVDLVLSGHTHGGQFWGNVLTYLGNDMVYGKKKFGTMTAITSSGIGAGGVPAKLGAPCEMVVVEGK